MVIVNNRDKVNWTEGMTVTDLLKKMNYSYVLITVTIDDQLIPTEDYSHQLVPDESNVTVFHLAHGG